MSIFIFVKLTIVTYSHDECSFKSQDMLHRSFIALCITNSQCDHSWKVLFDWKSTGINRTVTTVVSDVFSGKGRSKIFFFFTNNLKSQVTKHLQRNILEEKLRFFLFFHCTAMTSNYVKKKLYFQKHIKNYR